MAKPEEFTNQDTGLSGAREHTSSQDSSIVFTSESSRSEYVKSNPDANYGVGASGSVSTAGKPSSGGGSLAPFIHPFKLERVLDPDDPNSTKVRVYEGDIYAKIDTFKLDLVTITTGASHTHSAGSYAMPDHSHNQGGTAAAKTGTDITEGDTGSGTDHTHGVTGLSATVADHYHTSGGSGAGSGQQLKFRQHTHSLPNTTGDPTSGGSYSGGDHTHDLGGSTGNVDGFGGSPPAPEDITGNTGGIATSAPSSNVSGTLANESSHTHKYNKDDHSHTLTGQTGGLYSSAGIINTSGTNSNSAATHNIVVIAGQDQPDPVNPISTTWTTAFNKFVLLDDGSNSLFKYHESSHADGDFYAKWVITIDGDAKVQTVVGSIHRVALGGNRPDDDPFGDLTQSNTGALTRGQNTGTFYQKIGTVNGGIVQQKQFSNINWSMTVLPTVS